MSNLMTDLGTKVGSEFKAHRIRIEALESGSTQSKKGYGTGASGGEAFFLNETTINTSYTVPANYNAGSFGPITIANGVTVTVGDGSAWSIV